MKLPSDQRKTRPIAGVLFKLPLMIDCETFEGFITEYLDGVMPMRRHFVFTMHLRLCPECRAYLKQYEKTIAMTRSQSEIGYSEMGMGPVPEDLVNAVLAAQNIAVKK